MKKKTISSISNQMIIKALRAAVKKAVLEYRKNGGRMAVWKNGKVALISASKIDLKKL